MRAALVRKELRHKLTSALKVDKRDDGKPRGYLRDVPNPKAEVPGSTTAGASAIVGRTAGEKDGTPAVALLADVLAETAKETDWVARNLLAIGAIGILSGDYYLGKSTFLALFLAHVAAGRPFLGFDISRPLPVLY